MPLGPQISSAAVCPAYVERRCWRLVRAYKLAETSKNKPQGLHPMNPENIRPSERTHGRKFREPVQWPQNELLEHTHDAVIVWELGGEGIIYWNRAAEMLYGWRREEVRGRTTHDLLQTELTTGSTDDLENAIISSSTWVGELQHTTRMGKRIHVETRIVLLPTADDRWIVAEFNREVTNRSRHRRAEDPPI